MTENADELTVGINGLNEHDPVTVTWSQNGAELRVEYMTMREYAGRIRPQLFDRRGGGGNVYGYAVGANGGANVGAGGYGYAAQGREMAEQTASRAREASRRAAERLRASLSPQQLRDYTERQYFEVVSNVGRRWRILCSGSYTYNISLRHPDGSYTAFCAHIRNYPDFCPVEDHYLAQALMLRTDEAKFRSLAFKDD